uniref:Uncharacterized protein n=1 Tax=Mola mola TaxID=94237 RepID=A0A3Q4BAX5_MOLML
NFTGSCSARPPFKLPRSQVTVEPVMFLATFSVAMQAPLSTQYLWDRISEELGYNSSRTSECSNLSLNQDPLKKVAYHALDDYSKFHLSVVDQRRAHKDSGSPMS